MKKYVLILALLLYYFSPKAQTFEDNNLKMRISEIENRTALRELVDTFSILADKKEVQKQTELFTESAIVETYRNGELVSRLEGPKEIGVAFENFLKNFEAVYHFNGQHLVSINGDKATGILYCTTYLIRSENGKKIKTT
ncbi:MAG: nuclear transport factor 2 family protein, partial [Flavobacterium sp.]|nr:nuclear transport factor 2 family protein [Flavobacterium sp.]